jgi:hypothetical protein
MEVEWAVAEAQELGAAKRKTLGSRSSGRLMLRRGPGDKGTDTQASLASQP